MEILKKELINYFEHLEADVHFTYMEIHRDLRKGTIHDLRIALKRLQAFIKMWGAVNPHFPEKSAVKRFRTLFVEAGRLRDLHIEISLISTKEEMLKLNNGTSKQVADRIKEQKRIFREFEEAFSVFGIRETCMQVASQLRKTSIPHLRIGLRKYFQDLLCNLSRLSREGMRSKNCLHELRRQIKEAQYNLIAIDKATPHIRLSMDLLKPLETLQNQLGKWHDHCITIEKSKNLWNVPQSLRRQLRRDEAQYLKEIRSFLAQLPQLCDLLWDEMDRMLKPQKENVKEDMLNQLN